MIPCINSFTFVLVLIRSILVRLDVQLMIRGQLAIDFENKEGARREREFKRRGVHLEVQPYPLEFQED